MTCRDPASVRDSPLQAYDRLSKIRTRRPGRLSLTSGPTRASNRKHPAMTTAVRSLLHLSLLLGLSLVVSGCLPDPAEPDAADSATDSDKTAGKGRKGRGGGGGADAKGGGAAMPVSGSTATQKEVGTDPDGKPVLLFQLTNSGGMRVDVTNWGATVLAVRVPDQDERYENVTLAFENIEDYYVPGPYFGATCGRYSNRIASGPFSIADQIGRAHV